MKNRLANILPNINILSRHGDGNPELTGMAYDSRLVEPGFAFFALKGIHTDGHRYISKAIEKGALAIFHSESLTEFHRGIVYLQVEDTRKVLSPAAAAFYRHPSREMGIVGITGTDGKSTTVSLTDQLLESTGCSVGYLSTVAFKPGDTEEKNLYRQSTPEANQVHEFLRRMRENGKEYAVVESTSHGLSSRNQRLADVDYNVAVLTNVTQEHLEFHGTVEQYRDDKANLFRLAAASTDPRGAIINLDDPHHRLYMEASETMPLFTYSRKDPQASLFAETTEVTTAGTRFRLSGELLSRTGELYLPFPGTFNLENLMAALLAAHRISEKPLSNFLPHIEDLKPVKGRMSPVDEGQDFTVLVDYAHSPGAFESLLPWIQKTSKGKVRVVFGSAGERDRKKRPLQGAIASRYADVLYLTDEDPRGEDPIDILHEIAAGCTERIEGKDLFLLPDRTEAICAALTEACPDDTVLILGKGHETTIEYKDGSHPWDDHKTARNILKKRI